MIGHILSNIAEEFKASWISVRQQKSITFRKWIVLQYRAFIECPLGYIGVAMILAGVCGFVVPFWYLVFPRDGLAAAIISFWGGWAIVGIEYLKYRRKERLSGKP